MPERGAMALFTVCRGQQFLAVHDHEFAKQLLSPPSFDASAAKDNMLTLASKTSVEMLSCLGASF
eukprot:4555913-Prorocentrum_lima.AAC.1